MPYRGIYFDFNLKHSYYYTGNEILKQTGLENGNLCCRVLAFLRSQI